MLLVVVVTIACRREPIAQSADLATYLRDVAALDRTGRDLEIASWRFDAAGWNRTVVEPYRAVFDDYVRAFDPDRLVGFIGDIDVRPHFADDPKLTAGQARARWALPVAFPSQVATAAGAPIDAVFVRDGDRWRVIVGLDVIINDRVDRRDRACATAIDRQLPSKRCRDVAWVVADAALRTDDARFARACALAATTCGTPSP